MVEISNQHLFDVCESVSELFVGQCSPMDQWWGLVIAELIILSKSVGEISGLTMFQRFNFNNKLLKDRLPHGEATLKISRLYERRRVYSMDTLMCLYFS